jgi:Zn-dependent protease/predicted transcriptional regulator
MYIGRFTQIKVFIHWSFLLLIGYIVYAGVSAGQTAEAISWHLLFILTIFLCVVLHEFGHALTARRFGFKTKDIILLPIGGVARFEELPENPKQEFLVAIAGPMVNFLIAFLLYLLIGPAVHSLLDSSITSIDASNFLTQLLVINLLLGLFNLIPAFPMDGGRIFRAVLSMFLPRVKATKMAAGLGFIFATGFVFIGFFYNPFLILIGVFIMLSASSESSLVSTQALLKGHTAGDIVMYHFASLDSTMTLADASKAVLDEQATNFTVTSNGTEILGTLNRDQIIKSLTSKDHQLTKLAELMNPITLTVPVQTPLKELYSNPVIRTNVLVPVTDEGEVVGVINLENIMEFLAIKKATPMWRTLLARK